MLTIRNNILFTIYSYANSMQNIIEMYLTEKKTLQEIASIYNISYNKVRNFLLLNNIKIRSVAESIKLSSYKISAKLKGQKRKQPISDVTRNNMSLARLKHANIYAKGISLKPNGYYEITRGEHKGRLLHVVIIEQHINRKLFANECVHHKDGNRQNNNIENLELMTRAEHARLHRLESIDKIERDNLGRFKSLSN